MLLRNDEEDNVLLKVLNLMMKQGVCITNVTKNSDGDSGGGGTTNDLVVSTRHHLKVMPDIFTRNK